MKKLLMIAATLTSSIASASITYPIVDTAQVHSYDGRTVIEYPDEGDPYHGQDAQYSANAPSYKDNGDGTVSDLVTGLMWTQSPGAKKTYKSAVSGASKCDVGDYNDWRLPTIKELYSLIQLNGTDPDPSSTDESELTPFIDDSVFDFTYGQQRYGERIIDSQFVTSTKYVSTTMGGNETIFGVNFADGRIKGYPIEDRRGEKKFFVLYVRNNPEYGVNKFNDNGDGTITDQATGLTWAQQDSQETMDWPTALDYSENLEFAGHSDWRLPNAKELQSIIDYTRSPDTTQSAAIDPIFQSTEIINEGGATDFAHYWTSSTHPGVRDSSTAVYFAFGRSLGFMQDRHTGEYELQDVHGAGSQRSDPKTGDPSEFPHGRGPQGDVIRIYNMVRVVRGGDVTRVENGPPIEEQKPRPPKKRNSDNKRNSDEKRNGRTGGFMQNEDANQDGHVSKEEFRGPPEHFDRLDKNNDGYISEDEAPTGPPPGRE